MHALPVTADTVIAYVTHDDRAQHIISGKPVRCEATWRQGRIELVTARRPLNTACVAACLF